MSCVIVDYSSGNLHSAQKSFQRMARETGYDGDVRVTADLADVHKADHIVLPGVGAFADCRKGLGAIPDLFEAIAARVQAGIPFLGICVGAQMMATRGHEHGLVTPGFDWISGDVVAIAPSDPKLKIPHMGWNALDLHRSHPVLDGIEAGSDVYFVHSYHLVPDDPAVVVASADHGGPITAMIARDNIVGTQFHPEKSQSVGLRLIANFLTWRP